MAGVKNAYFNLGDARPCVELVSYSWRDSDLISDSIKASNLLVSIIIKDHLKFKFKPIRGELI